MADEPDRPDETPSVQPAPPPAAGQTPAKKVPAKKAPAKKAPAKKAPVKKAVPPQKAAGHTPAKKAPAKKAPAKKAPAKKAPAVPTPADPVSPVKEVAAQAKSTVASVQAPLTAVPSTGPDQSRWPVAAALVAGVLAVLVVYLARRGSDVEDA